MDCNVKKGYLDDDITQTFSVYTTQVLLPCNIDFNLAAPKGKGQHISVSIPEIMLNISPETIKILSAASQSLTPQQVIYISQCFYS